MTSRDPSVVVEEVRALVSQELVYLSGIRPRPSIERVLTGGDEPAAAGPAKPAPSVSRPQPVPISAVELRSLVAQMRAANGVPPPGTGPGSSALAEEPSPGPTSVNVRRHLPRIITFRDEHGHLPRTGPTVPQAERTLGMWLYRRRRAKAAGTLPPEDESAITDALGFGWSDQKRRRRAR